MPAFSERSRQATSLSSVTPPAELPRVDLGDALAVCGTIRRAEPERFERAALRWLARFCLERREATLTKSKQQHGRSTTSPTSQPLSRHSNGSVPASQAHPPPRWRKHIAGTSLPHSD